MALLSLMPQLPYIRIICQGIRRVGIFAGMFMVGTTPSKGI